MNDFLIHFPEYILINHLFAYQFDYHSFNSTPSGGGKHQIRKTHPSTIGHTSEGITTHHAFRLVKRIHHPTPTSIFHTKAALLVLVPHRQTP